MEVEAKVGIKCFRFYRDLCCIHLWQYLTISYIDWTILASAWYILYAIVLTQDEYDTFVITQVQGKAEDE